MRPTEKKLTSVLINNGYKLTNPRRVIIRTIVGSHEHLTPADVYNRVRIENPQIGLVTVYRTLDLLSSLGLICQVHGEGRSTNYTLSPIGHHHHMICSNCGAVEDFTDCNLSELEEKLARETGFEIEGHLLEFSGICITCQANHPS